MAQGNTEKTPLEARINEVLDLLDAAICKNNRIPKEAGVKNWEQTPEVERPDLNKTTELSNA